MKIADGDDGLVTMNDGTRVQVDGRGVMNDGSSRVMMEGKPLSMANKPDEPPEQAGTETHDPG